jgi:ABC-2 type transport system ATP-binding protein
MDALNAKAPPVEVRNLTKRYKDGTRANRDITLTIERGELLGIVGPNGAGKTTLVRQITTELLPTSGEVRVFGIDAVAHPYRVKGLMGVMPQEANLYYELSVRHHLRIFGKLRGLPRKEASGRADELLSVLGLQEHRDKSANELSGGLRRRVLLGIAALADPPLMVLDEPSAGLDPEARHELWELLRDYRRRGSTVLLTTHYMEEAEALCDRVGIIQDGRLLALDTIANLRADHGFEYKIVYETDDRTRTVYGADDRSLVQQVQSDGIREYSISRTTLEDVYLGLTGGEGRLTAEDEC